MKLMLRLLCASGLILMLEFCVVGFIATFEPMPSSQRMIWRTVYSLAGISSVLGLFPLLRSLFRCLQRPRHRSNSDPATPTKPRSAGTLA
jgi:hypothetical protein